MFTVSALSSDSIILIKYYTKLSIRAYYINYI